MTKLSSNIKQSLKDTLLFDAFYFFIFFLLLISTFTDGSQITGMFILIDFFVVVLMTAYYLIFNLTIQLTGRTIGILTRALLLFVLAELSVLTLTGELPILGLMQKYIYSKKPYSSDKTLDDSIYLFRQTRDFIFSISGLASAVIFLTIKRLTKNNSHQQKVLQKLGN